MKRLTAQQRKLAYLGGIIVLLVPIIWLGIPSAPATGSQSGDPGGKLAQLRTQYDLGEHNLGDVDPTSATMNLVLLGLRGIAANVLWLEMDHYKDTKNWAQMEATTESIIKLQPHFQQVWIYNGWNLAYNVSVEWDDVRDRYRWVKRGIKFYRRGAARNSKYPELYWYTGNTFGKKIGRSDEWRQFRRYFKEDPDFVDNGVNVPDPDLNPDGTDNYLVAKQWFSDANRVWDEYGNSQHIMARVLFRSYPARSQLDYAEALQREGHFDEVTQLAWDEGFRDWTRDYGMEPVETPGGTIRLEWTPEQIAREHPDKEQQRQLLEWLGRYQNMTNYRFWRTKALAEREPNTVAAHRDLYQGLQAFIKGDTVQAEKLTYSGMEKFEKMLEDFRDLRIEQQMIEEGMLGVLVWQDAVRLNGGEIPERFPLYKLWTENQDSLPQIRMELDRRLSPDY